MGYGGDVWMLGVDNSGTLLWQNCVGSPDPYELVSDMITDDNENCIIIGSTRLHNPNYEAGLIAKLDSHHNLIFLKTIGGDGTDLEPNRIDRLTSLLRTKDNTYLLAGYANSSTGDLKGVQHYSEYAEQAIWLS